MAELHGPNGIMNLEQITALLRDKTGSRRVTESACGRCATHLQNAGLHPGGGTEIKYKGKPVYHFSCGQKDRKSGCTIFFTVEESGDHIIAGLVAVGWHENGAGNTATYKIDWGKGSFRKHKFVTL